jgi:hypothetical protein
MSFTDVFNNQTLPPAEYGYNALVLTGDLTVFWPYNVSDTDLTIAKITEASCAAGNILTLPDARQVSVGEDFLIRNTGANPLQVNNALGVVVSTVQPGAANYFYLADNTTEGGLFSVIGFGVGTSTVDAASLVGYGIKAIGASLNQTHPVQPVGSGVTIDATHRAQLVVLTGGASTFDLTSAVTLGDDFFTLIRNEGTGTLTIDGDGSDTIDGQASIQVQPSESLMLVCTGTQWYSVGYGRSVLYQFTQLTKDVSAGGTITLTAAEASNKLLTFIGNPASDVTVVAPSIVAVYYTHNNISTANDVNFKTAAGAAVPIGQGTRLIILCDGTDMLSAQSATANSSVSLVDGSAASPALFFASQTNTGLYKSGVDGIGISVDGVAVVTFTSSGGAQIFLPQGYSQYNTVASAPAYAEGKVFYDNVERTLAYYNEVNGITVNIGQEHLTRVRNVTGGILLNGTPVYISGASSGLPSVAKAKADVQATSESTIGLLTADIANNSNGYCTVDGIVHDLDTSAFLDGDTLYVSAATAGAITKVRPVAPNHAVRLGYVIKAHATTGQILVRIDLGLGLAELHDVKFTALADTNLIQWDAAGGFWKNVSGISLATQVSGILQVANGGTAGNTQATARTGLGIPGSVQNAEYLSLGTIAGTNTITAVGTPAVTAYAANQTFRFLSAGANTGPTTLNIDGLGPKNVMKAASSGPVALVAGDIPAAGIVLQVTYDGTQFQLTSNTGSGAGDVTLTGTQTLTNKTLVSPKIKAGQFGDSGTATRNFTLTAEAADGTMKLARGNAGATTQDIMTVDSAGRATFPQGGPTLKTSASAPYTPVGGELLSRPHGLSFVPSSAKLILECVVADAGYSVGDKFSMQHQWTGTTVISLSVYTDSTNCAAKFNPSYASCIYTKSTGNFVTPTANAWKYYFEVTS